MTVPKSGSIPHITPPIPEEQEEHRDVYIRGKSRIWGLVVELGNYVNMIERVRN